MFCQSMLYLSNSNPVAVTKKKRCGSSFFGGELGRLEWWEVALRYMENTQNNRDFVNRVSFCFLFSCLLWVYRSVYRLWLLPSWFWLTCVQMFGRVC